MFIIPNIRLEDDLLYGDIKLEKWEKRFNKSLNLELMLKKIICHI